VEECGSNFYAFSDPIEPVTFSTTGEWTLDANGSPVDFEIANYLVGVGSPPVTNEFWVCKENDVLRVTFPFIFN
jgi:hypothetical protein